MIGQICLAVVVYSTLKHRRGVGGSPSVQETHARLKKHNGTGTWMLLFLSLTPKTIKSVATGGSSHSGVEECLRRKKLVLFTEGP